MFERIEGFPLDYGQLLDSWKMMITQSPDLCVLDTPKVRLTDGEEYSAVIVRGRGWNVSFFIWFDLMPRDCPRMTFNGDVGAFEEDYIEMKLRS